MPSPMEMLHEWDRKMEWAKGLSPREVIQLRMRLLREEHEEVREELVNCLNGRTDRQALTKELADLAYMVYGTASPLGIDLDAALEEVHRSNLSKLGNDGKPILRADGKILKGPNYRPPDLFEASGEAIDSEAEEIHADI